MKSSAQLGHKIVDAQNRGRSSQPGSNRPWWVWRISSTPPKAQTIQKVELPWAYSWAGRTEGQPFSRADISSLGFGVPTKIKTSPYRFGSMLVVEVTRPGMRRMLTPPLHMFADLKKIDPHLDLRDIGSPRFWLQPEVYQVTQGEIYQGPDVQDLIDINRGALSEATDQRAVNNILVALDAYLMADKPDARFV